MSEEVLVVKNELITGYLPSYGLRIINKDKVLDVILNNYSFVQRDIAENDFNYKQIIPYVVISHGCNYLLLKRKSAQTERRLHNKFSLGIGGHINLEKQEGQQHIILKGLYRELNEEVQIKEPFDLEYIGYINDDTVEVSKVHLGLFYLLKTTNPYFNVLEEEKMEGDWVDESYIKQNYSSLETWSQIVCDFIFTK